MSECKFIMFPKSPRQTYEEKLQDENKELNEDEVIEMINDMVVKDYGVSKFPIEYWYKLYKSIVREV